jgi:23S rRNA (uracil1939-C5)-methyltransferase
MTRDRRSRRAARWQAAEDSPEIEVDVLRLGEQGDGIAETPVGRLYVPLTTIGDRVRVRAGRRRGDGFAADVLSLVSPGPGRADPPCPHFATCGGCALQHLADPTYAAWKIDRMRAALARAGLSDYQMAPLARTPPGGRRRASFTASRPAGSAGVHIGFQVRGSHSVVDLAVCPVVEPAIAALLSPLRSLLAELLLPGSRARVEVTRLDGGLDVLVEGLLKLNQEKRLRLAHFAQEADLARISWRQSGDDPVEPLALRRPPRAVFGGVPVAIPAGAFLQASAAGETALLAAVREAIPPRSAVADLFSGCGTFTLPLAAGGARVHAVDIAAEAIATLAAAARGEPTLAARITCERRNLFVRPLVASELARFGAVIIDPPRAGARAQAQALPASRVATIVYISCNPASFARDARLLADGGFRLETVTPVDQFLWSPHLELVGVFERHRYPDTK